MRRFELDNKSTLAPARAIRVPSAGMRVVGFTGASHTYPSHAERLMEAGAETTINKLSDFPAVVDAFKSWDGRF